MEREAMYCPASVTSRPSTSRPYQAKASTYASLIASLSKCPSLTAVPRNRASSSRRAISRSLPRSSASCRSPASAQTPASAAAGHLPQRGPPRLDGPVLQKAPQVVGQLLRGRVALGRGLGQRLEHDGFQVGRDDAVQRPRFPRLIPGDAFQHLLAILAV